MPGDRFNMSDGEWRLHGRLLSREHPAPRCQNNRRVMDGIRHPPARPGGDIPGHHRSYTTYHNRSNRWSGKLPEFPNGLSRMMTATARGNGSGAG